MSTCLDGSAGRSRLDSSVGGSRVDSTTASTITAACTAALVAIELHDGRGLGSRTGGGCDKPGRSSLYMGLPGS